ncbi:hypothetical protein C7405_112171 [Paraburkholderia caballeronis]|uniref:hypothetical protein n=1 Tax=Paraburkholderia caballeronis TaxID=416943 RepID=UPI0010669BFB|nr:hypothetical protein [Paraburkholderia caballeronis]TDV32858.1 hypothetical protein C7405_112171 [Paraburkholderia caballeronis]
MDSKVPLPPGALASSLIDQEIAHIRRVMPLSLNGDLGGPILPAPYWRQRLYQLLDSGLVGKGQLGEIDSLLLLLDDFERRAANAGAPPKSAGGTAEGR